MDIDMLEENNDKDFDLGKSCKVFQVYNNLNIKTTIFIQFKLYL